MSKPLIGPMSYIRLSIWPKVTAYELPDQPRLNVVKLFLLLVQSGSI